jgi:hypothetical protein
VIKLSAMVLCRYGTLAEDGWVLGGLFRQIKLSELQREGVVPCIYVLLTDITLADQAMLDFQIIDPEADDEPLYAEAGLLMPRAGQNFADFCIKAQALKITRAGRYDARLWVDDILLDVASMDVVED